MWGKVGVEFATKMGLKISAEVSPTAILITDGVEEGKLGMMTTFCHSDQAKMEASKAWLPYDNVIYQSKVWWW